jgi:alpha-glucosidase
VCPVESGKDLVKIYLPEGEWYYLYTGKKYDGNHEIIIECPIPRLPVFVKGSSIIPMQPVVSNTSETTGQLILHIYSGEIKNTFDYYEDDGQTFSYQSGKYHLRSIEFSPSNKTVIIKKATGEHQSTTKRLKVMLHSFADFGSVKINGAQQNPQKEMNRYFEGLEKFDPFYDPEPAPEESVQTIEVDYTSEEILISW